MTKTKIFRKKEKIIEEIEYSTLKKERRWWNFQLFRIFLVDENSFSCFFSSKNILCFVLFKKLYLNYIKTIYKLYFHEEKIKREKKTKKIEEREKGKKGEIRNLFFSWKNVD